MSRATRILRKTARACTPASARVEALRGVATIHSCRDTYATRLLTAGVALGEVSKLLGHASLQQTMKFARYESRQVDKDAVAFLNKMRCER